MMETTIVQRIGEPRHNERLRALLRFLLVTFVTLSLFAIAQSIPSKVMAAEQLTFATPDAAVDALVAAVAADTIPLNAFVGGATEPEKAAVYSARTKGKSSQLLAHLDRQTRLWLPVTDGAE